MESNMPPANCQRRALWASYSDATGPGRALALRPRVLFDQRLWHATFGTPKSPAVHRTITATEHNPNLRDPAPNTLLCGR
jgi:hypothetical protein